MAYIPWLPTGNTTPLFSTRIGHRKEVEIGTELGRCFDIEFALICRVQVHMCLSVGVSSFKGESRIYRCINDYDKYWAVAGDR